MQSGDNDAVASGSGEPIKRNHNSENGDNMQLKKPKVLKHEDVYLNNLPSCENYEKSYMHRDEVSHVYATKTQFLITASVDGVIKFWKKTGNGIEFVKNFKSHAGPVDDISVTPSGSELASISGKDKSMKIFDIVNFDMINMFMLKFEPRCVEWLDQSSSSAAEDLAVSDCKCSTIYLFNAKQSSSEPKRILSMHSAIVCCISLNPVNKIVISADIEGNLEYWRTSDGNFKTAYPPHVNFLSKNDTDFSHFAKGDSPSSPSIKHISFSPNGEFFAVTTSDRKIRILRFKTGKIVRIFDESLETIQELHKNDPLMDNASFGRRMAIEREIDKYSNGHMNVVFDQSGHFILYPTMVGIKLYNWKTNRLVLSFGKKETNFRPLCISLFQGLIFERALRKFNIDSLEAGLNDPTLFSTSFKSKRFYCFSRRNFEEDVTEGEGGELIKDRDIFNEKPTREEIMSAIEIEQLQQQQKKEIYENATIHTTMGDIHLKLFPELTPKACENFCTLSKNNYYNNHIFHRVIKQFMIQTGDPTGTGTGGESIWNDEFEDEFREELNHSRPFTLSMANCGPNTNGSQFFITVVPCPFLDRKHTVFGRVVKGMDVCQNISKVKTDLKTDKPYTDIKIININVY